MSEFNFKELVELENAFKNCSDDKKVIEWIIQSIVCTELRVKRKKYDGYTYPHGGSADKIRTAFVYFMLNHENSWVEEFAGVGDWFFRSIVHQLPIILEENNIDPEKLKEEKIKLFCPWPYALWVEHYGTIVDSLIRRIESIKERG